MTNAPTGFEEERTAVGGTLNCRLKQLGKLVQNITDWVEVAVMLVITCGGKFDVPGEPPFFKKSFEEMTPDECDERSEWVHHHKEVSDRIRRIRAMFPW